MKSLKEVITEAIHTGSMHLHEIIHILVKDYNMNWMAPKKYPELAKFLPHSKVEDLDVERTKADMRCGIEIAASKTSENFGLSLHYISTEKSQYGDGTLRRNLDWTSMSKDTLQNITICLRKILNDVENDIEKEYTKHPNYKYLEIDIKDMVSDKTPRNFYTRGIKVGAMVRELTKNDKSVGFSWIIDIEINPDNPQQRLSIGIDKNDCLRWTWQTTYGECKKGFDTPRHLIKWDEVEDKVATMLNSY